MAVAAVTLVGWPVRAALAVDPYLSVTKDAVALTQCEQAEIRLYVAGAGSPVTTRLPLDVMTVIDRSGSMSGQPLADAKVGAKALVDQLDSTIDCAALTSFATPATLNIGLTNNFAGVKSASDALSANGTTNIGDRVFDAQAEIAAHGRSAPTVRVMVLLSDGVANLTHAPTASGCSRRCRRRRACPTS